MKEEWGKRREKEAGDTLCGIPPNFLQVEKLLAAAQAAAANGGAGAGAAAPAAEGGAAAAAAAGAGGDDPLKYGPRPDALVPKVAQQGELLPATSLPPPARALQPTCSPSSAASTGSRSCWCWCCWCWRWQLL